MRWWFPVFVLVWFCVWLSPASAESRRVALLIGNKSYSQEIGPLQNPHNDVEAIAGALRQVGFRNEDVRVVKDATEETLVASIDSFARQVAELKLGPDDVVFFYYSGHGAVPSGSTLHLIPVDAAGVSDTLFWRRTVDFQDVVAKFEAANSGAAWVLAIDACRNELKLPLKNLGGGEKAFGAVPTAAGMLIAYAAESGQTARDVYAGSRGTSPYAAALSEALVQPGESLESSFTFVRGKVLELTSGAQSPVQSVKLNRTVYLKEPAAIDGSGADPQQVAAARRALQAIPEKDWNALNTKRLLERATQAAPINAILALANAGDTHAARLAGFAFQEGLAGLPKNEAAAEEIFEADCNRGGADGCWMLGYFRVADAPDQQVSDFYEQACKLGSAQGCTIYAFALAGLLEGSDKSKLNVDRAASLFSQACSAGHGDACAGLAVMHKDKIIYQPSESAASGLFAEACGLGSYVGCSEIIDVNATSGGLIIAPEVAVHWRALIDILDSDCDASDAERCFNLGSIYGTGVKLSSGQYLLREDRVASSKLFLKACELGDMNGCALSGIALLEGAGVPEDAKRGFELLGKTCITENLFGCAGLAKAYAQGLGTSKNLPEALRLYDRACELGYSASCFEAVGILREAKPGDPEIVRRQERLCAEQVNNYCIDLGFDYYDGNGTAKNYAKAKVIFEKYCELGAPDACMGAGWVAQEEKRYKDAFKFLDPACGQNLSGACSVLGLMYIEGQGVQADRGRGIGLLRKALSLDPQDRLAADMLRALGQQP